MILILRSPQSLLLCCTALLVTISDAELLSFSCRKLLEARDAAICGRMCPKPLAPLARGIVLLLIRNVARRQGAAAEPERISPHALVRGRLRVLSSVRGHCQVLTAPQALLRTLLRTHLNFAQGARQSLGPAGKLRGKGVRRKLVLTRRDEAEERAQGILHCTDGHDGHGPHHR